MFAFTDEERAQLTETRAITTDAQGHEVLVGLTLEETAFVMDRRRKFQAGKRDHKGKKRAVELGKKHELARSQILGADIELRTDKPTRH